MTVGLRFCLQDRSLVRVALLNVLHNAVKFSPDQSTIHIGFSRQESDGRVFQRICVHDSGPGLATGEVTRYFYCLFFTSSSPSTSKYSGSGLGLSIAKLIVDRNGGQIFFDMSVEHGAKCCVDLPLL